MTDILITLARKTDQAQEVAVHWLYNNHHGCLRVTLKNQSADDVAIMAELAGIHHLILNRNLARENRHGKNLTLAVSTGAIRRLFLGASLPIAPLKTLACRTENTTERCAGNGRQTVRLIKHTHVDQ